MNRNVQRKYELKRRAERQAETRRRIVEAAVELHGTIGPSRTTISAIAERAGVQRLTVYRHFPDERALFTACSGQHAAKYPLPDPEPWREIADPEQRLRAGLSEVYAYYRRHEQLLTHVLRDAEIHPVLRDTVRRRFEYLARARDVLAQGRRSRGRRRARLLAALGHALDFSTWRSLADQNGLSDHEAIELMLGLVRSV